jgi:hypothetical protein
MRTMIEENGMVEHLGAPPLASHREDSLRGCPYVVMMKRDEQKGS